MFRELEYWEGRLQQENGRLLVQIGLEKQLLLHCNILMYVVLTFSSLLQLRSVPPHCLRGLRFLYSQLESLTCSKCISTLEVSVSVQLTGSYAGDQIGKCGGNLINPYQSISYTAFSPLPILMSYLTNNDEVFLG